MWSWFFEKKAEPPSPQLSLTPEEEKIFEKPTTDVKQIFQIGAKIASGVFGTVYQVLIGYYDTSLKDDGVFWPF